MAEPESLHSLELAVKSLEGKIDTLTAKVDGKFDNVLELIRHGDSENQARIEANTAKIDALAARITEEVRARNELEERIAKRVENVDLWRSSLGEDFPKVIQYVRDSKAQLRLWRALGAAATTVIVALLIALLTKALRIA